MLIVKPRGSFPPPTECLISLQLFSELLSFSSKSIGAEELITLASNWRQDITVIIGSGGKISSAQFYCAFAKKRAAFSHVDVKGDDKL